MKRGHMLSSSDEHLDKKQRVSELGEEEEEKIEVKEIVLSDEESVIGNGILSNSNCDTSRNSNFNYGIDIGKAVENAVRKTKKKKKTNITWKCKNCHFKTDTKDKLISHLLTGYFENDIKIKCDTCPYKCFSIKQMKVHILSHHADGNHMAKIIVLKGSLLSNNVSLIRNLRNRTICNPVNCDKMNSISIVCNDSSCKIPMIYRAENDEKAQCFDCDSGPDRRGRKFEMHTYQHFGSKFQCLEHLGKSVNDCSKCYYEKVLEIIKKELLSCKDCGFTTFDILVMNNHKIRIVSCKTRGWRPSSRTAPGEYLCSGCKYITKSKELLYYHMIDHLDKFFKCHGIHDPSETECVLCINKEYLDKAKKEVKICQTCQFKTLLPEVFNHHKCVNTSGSSSARLINSCDVNSKKNELVNSSKESVDKMARKLFISLERIQL